MQSIADSEQLLARLPSTLGALIRSQARSRPSALAVREGAVQLTFRELDREADRLAAGLIDLGVCHGDAIALLLPNSAEWLIATVGAARIGAVTVPMNTWYQEDELRYALAHSGAVALIVAERVGRHLLYEKVERVCAGLGTERPGGEAAPDLRTVVILGERKRGTITWGELLARGRPESVAPAEEVVQASDDLFIIYTSGSTARPKGVRLQHGAAIENAFLIGARQGVEAADRTWLVQPLFWALAAVNMLLSSWTHGSAVVLQRFFDAREGLELIEQAGITRAYAIGNISHALIALPEFPDANIESLTKGVALFSPADRRIAVTQLGMRSFVSLYGGTETHGVCFSADYRDPLEQRMQDCGSALPGWTWRLADPETGALMKEKSGRGEVLVRGRLARGYHKDPAQTQAAFDSDGYFHTGDIVEIDAHGRLEFVGRVGEMIKTGGISVSPADVEETLSAHPGIVQAYIVGIPDPVHGQVVAAVIEPRGGLDPDGVRRWLKARAASYKVPRLVRMVSADEIPRLSNGKVARKLLHTLFAPSQR